MGWGTADYEPEKKAYMLGVEERQFLFEDGYQSDAGDDQYNSDNRQRSQRAFENEGHGDLIDQESPAGADSQGQVWVEYFVDVNQRGDAGGTEQVAQGETPPREVWGGAAPFEEHCGDDLHNEKERHVNC